MFIIYGQVSEQRFILGDTYYFTLIGIQYFSLGLRISYFKFKLDLIFFLAPPKLGKRFFAHSHFRQI